MPIPELAHLSDAHCVIESFGRSHRALVVRVYKDPFELICYLTFYSPPYIEMPFHWVGAAFEIAENSELEEYAQKNLSGIYSLEPILRFHKLYKVKIARNDETSTFVKIIAQSLKMIEDGKKSRFLRA